MQTCSNCGASVREGARFCTACGTQLNDASSGSSAFSWGATTEQTAASPVAPEAPGGTASDATSGQDESENEAITDSASLTVEQPDQHLPTEAVDEETGIVLDDPADEARTGLVDATEIDVLDAEPGVAEPEVVDEDAPDLSTLEDWAGAPAGESGVENDDQETLAVWAQRWVSEEETVVEEDIETVTIESTSIDEDAEEDDDPEITMKEAERLIAELQSLVPKLARPKPAKPQPITPRVLAEELDGLNDGEDWADLREVLEKARSNPNDITHLMNVSGNAERLLALLESRERLANGLSGVAQRLRDIPDDEQ
jgi:hypothetical protein